MASRVTHLMVADELLLLCPALLRRAFSVGSIAPDRNEENESSAAWQSAQKRRPRRALSRHNGRRIHLLHKSNRL